MGHEPAPTDRPTKRAAPRLAPRARMMTGEGRASVSPSATEYQNFTRTTGAELWERVDDAHRRFAQLIAEVDPESPAADSTWTTREVAAHVLSVLDRYTERDLRRPEGLSDDAAAVTAQNHAEMQRYTDLSPEALAETIGRRIDRIREILPASADLAERFPFHCDVTIDAAGFLGNLISELLVHGRDIARGAGRDLVIDRRDAVLILNCLLQVPAGFMRADAHPVKVGIHVGGAVPWLIDMQPGTADSRPRRERERVDVRLSGSPTALVLALHGRYSIVAAARHGLLLTGGRRPWRAMWVPGNVDSP